jgi:hypothetical protein
MPKNKFICFEVTSEQRIYLNGLNCYGRDLFQISITVTVFTILFVIYKISSSHIVTRCLKAGILEPAYPSVS